MSQEILEEELLQELDAFGEPQEENSATTAEDIATHNLGMILNVPLQVSVQIGKTKKPIKEIIEFKSGTIVELNKFAGEQADVLINGKCFAKGDIVIIDDTFCVRITEIVNNNDLNLRRY